MPNVMSIAVDSSEKLHCYASGNGALHFCWVENGKANGRRVTFDDAKNYLAGPEADHLRERGWRAVMLNTMPCLVADVSRVDEQTVRLRDENYTYRIDPENIFWTRDGEATDHALILETVLEDVGKITVRNISTRAAIRHFLNHELQLFPLPLDFQI